MMGRKAMELNDDFLNGEGLDEAMSLEDLEKMIRDGSTSPSKIARQKHISVKLPKSMNYVDICVLSNIQIGLTGPHKGLTVKEDKPFRINKLKAHIDELAKNPNARVFLGGDLFYFPGGTRLERELHKPSYDDQVRLMAQLLEPIKDKIIGAYVGTDEVKILEKDQRDLTKELMERLGIADRYCGQMAEVDFIFKNEYTGDVARTVNMIFDHGFLVASTLGTVSKKTKGLQDKLNGKDFYFTSHYNKMFIEKSAVLQADRGTHMIKLPCYFVSVGGYRDFPNRLQSNRNTAPANTNNGMIRVFVVQNPDRNNIHGNDYLGEPQFKVCQEFVNFGRTKPHEFNYDIIKEIATLTEENILNEQEIIEKLKEKIEDINKNIALDILTKSYYIEQDAPAKEFTKLVQSIKKQNKPTVINEDLEQKEKGE